jgi:hypothetical protein
MYMGEASTNNALKFDLPVLGHLFEEAKHVSQPQDKNYLGLRNVWSTETLVEILKK